MTTKIQELEERHQKDVKEVSKLKSLHEKDLIEISRLQNKINHIPLSTAEGSLHEDKISMCQSEFEGYDQLASSNFDSSISAIINSLSERNEILTNENSASKEQILEFEDSIRRLTDEINKDQQSWTKLQLDIMIKLSLNY